MCCRQVQSGSRQLVPGSWSLGTGAEIKPAQPQCPGAARGTPRLGCCSRQCGGQAALVSAPLLHVLPEAS